MGLTTRDGALPARPSSGEPRSGLPLPSLLGSSLRTGHPGAETAGVPGGRAGRACTNKESPTAPAPGPRKGARSPWRMQRILEKRAKVFQRDGRSEPRGGVENGAPAEAAGTSWAKVQPAFSGPP